ncbi:MAG: acyl-CoA dehydrogenase family protein [Planctomycetota bacterium]|nr:acyl-CoA dehydrogenase family protein [Planctomycetota bacterium]
MAPNDPLRKDAEKAAEARDIAESAREAAREAPSFAAELFLGRLAAELVHPFPEQDPADAAKAEGILADLESVLRAEVDPDAVERDDKIPDQALERLQAIGAFRMKIPEAYGGLGFSQTNYGRAVALASSHCGAVAIWMSGHQSIGVPTPLKLFGTDEQKQRYLPRLAAGELSAFALTEPDAGSDPAGMETRAEPHPDGGWVLNGTKLWCTNGPEADILIVMARTPDKVVNGKPRKQISAFIVESGWEGFEVVHRCEFVGYKGIRSGVLRFNDMRIPAENLLWNEGQGLKLALITLNTGRLTLPATNVAAARQCLRIVRQWAREREQWGGPIGAQEAIAGQVGYIAAHTFAMEAFSDYTAGLVDRGGTDFRIEAAMAKLFCSEVVFQIADRTMQVRAGRGYETADSLRARGVTAWPVERIWREARLNKIVEGTSEIMRLFIAREALDPHLQRLGALATPGSSFGAKLQALGRGATHYPLWFLSTWWPGLGAPDGMPSRLRGHWGWMRRQVKRLARRITYAMVRHRADLEHRQGWRMVDEAVDLTAMALAMGRAASRADAGSAELADLFCRHARRRIRERQHTPQRLDRVGAAVASNVLKDAYVELEGGIMPERRR